MAKYSKDLKEQAVKYVISGKSYQTASEIFGASVMSIRNWHKRYLELGHVKAFPYIGKRPRISNEAFGNYVKHHPDQTLKEIGHHFEMTAVGALYYMRKCGIKYKKKNRDTKKLVQKKGKNI
jgi:transposase